MELISVIVPIYNVQKFLSKCLDCLLAQTYKNIEIILVDDGSKDGSGEICDQYAEKHEQIKILHQLNAGPSKARNSGLDIANGKYVVFVDGDDIVSPYLVEDLYSLIQRNHADLGICNPVHCYPGGEVKFTRIGEERFLSSEEAIQEMLYQSYFFVPAWGKIYPISFFDKVRFPEGLLFEDSAIMYKLFDEAECIVFSSAELYGYVHRENSITTNRFSEHDFDILKICEQIELDMAGRSDSLKKAARAYHTASVLRVYMNMPHTDGFEGQRESCEKYLKKHCNMVLADKCIRKKLRIALLLYKYARFIMPWIYSRVNRWR